MPEISLRDHYQAIDHALSQEEPDWQALQDTVQAIARDYRLAPIFSEIAEAMLVGGHKLEVAQHRLRAIWSGAGWKYRVASQAWLEAEEER